MPTLHPKTVRVSDPTTAVAVVTSAASGPVQTAPDASHSVHEAHFERVRDGWLHGWVRRIDNAPIMGILELCVDSEAPRSVTLESRLDLAAAGIGPEGHAAFRARIADRLSPDATSVHLALTVQTADGRAEEFVATLPVVSGVPLVADPLVRVATANSLRAWSIVHGPRSAIRLDRFSAPPSLVRHVEAYTRVSVLCRQPGDEAVRLTAPMDAADWAAEPLEIGFLARADRPTVVTVRVVAPDDAELAREDIVVHGEWHYHRKPLVLTESSPPSSGAEPRLELVLATGGRGHLDIGLCYPAPEPSIGWARRHLGVARKEPVPALGSGDLVRNGDFSAWSRGLHFEAPAPRRPLCDHWSLEFRKPYAGAVRAGLAKTPSGAVDDRAGFGLRLQFGEFEGPMRAVTQLAANALDAESLSFRIELEAPADRGAARVRRILLLAFDAGEEKVVHVLARNPVVRGHTVLELAIDEAQTIALRRAAGGFSGLLLGIEFDTHTEVVLRRVSVRPGDVGASKTPSRCERTDPHFEDGAIAAQVHRLRGLEGWEAGGTVSPDGHGGAVADIRGWLAATWHRPDAGYPDVDIIVPVYNAREAVEACLRSLVRHTTVPHRVLIIDDASDEATAELLRAVAQRYPHVSCLRNAENIGYTRSVNRGMAASAAARVCVLNSDCAVTPRWLERLVDCSLSHPAIGMVGPLSNAASFQSVPAVKNREGTGWSFNPLPGGTTPDDVATLVSECSERAWPSVGVINGFCQLISRAVIERIGLLDEESFPRGFGEENDYCARAVKAGFRIVIADDAYVHHLKSQSFGHATRKELSKLGSAALRAKHPELDWKAITAEIENSSALKRIRERLVASGL